VPEGDEAAAEWLHKLYQQKVLCRIFLWYRTEKVCAILIEIHNLVIGDATEKWFFGYIRYIEMLK
jgi:hypothetical protein